MEHINGFKAGVSAFLALLTALWGWFGWLESIWIIFMGLDVLSGMCAALKNGEWSSKVAREGLWHKAGSILVVLTAALLDISIGVILPQIPGIPAEFQYTVFLCPLVTVWYIITEAGSVIENAAKLGIPIPPWLQKFLKFAKGTVDKTGDGITPTTEKE